MKRIESPVKKWPGYILFHDPIPLVHVLAFENAINGVDRNKFSSSSSQVLLLPSILPCVAEWHLEGFPENVTADSFPGTPRKDSSILISALINAITKIYAGDEETAPNV